MLNDCKGQKLSSDILLLLFEELEFDFDEAGQPNLPTLVCHPQLKETAERALREVEQDPRYTELMLLKRNKYYAQKRTRRLL